MGLVVENVAIAEGRSYAAQSKAPHVIPRDPLRYGTLSTSDAGRVHKEVVPQRASWPFGQDSCERFVQNPCHLVDRFRIWCNAYC